MHVVRVPVVELLISHRLLKVGSFHDGQLLSYKVRVRVDKEKLSGMHPDRDSLGVMPGTGLIVDHLAKMLMRTH